MRVRSNVKERALDICRASDQAKNSIRLCIRSINKTSQCMIFELGKREVRNKVSLKRVVSKDNVNTVATPIHHANARPVTRNVICVDVYIILWQCTKVDGRT